MRTLLRLLGLLAAVVVATPLVLLVLVNVAPGQRLVERLTARLTGGQVVLAGLGGSIPGAPRLARLELRDAAGVWLSVTDIRLDWSPLRLASGVASVQRLSAATLRYERAPQSSGTQSGGGGFRLPVRVEIASAHIDRLEAAGVVVAVDASVQAAALDRGEAALSAVSPDGGRYSAAAILDGDAVHATAAIREPAAGPIARLASLPALGAIAADARIDGPPGGLATTVSVAAGALRATARGRIDLVGNAADLDLAASAPAMSPRPDLGWDAVALDGHVQGPFATPDATLHLRVDGPHAGGARATTVTAEVAGNAGALTLRGAIEALHLPGPQPDLLAAAPVALTAAIRLDTPDRPASFTLSHPLIGLTGQARTGGAIGVQAELTLPDLSASGLGGRATATIRADPSSADMDAVVALAAPPGPLAALAGPATRIGVSARRDGGDVSLTRFTMDGGAASLSATGAYRAGAVSLDWRAALSDLAALAPTVAGRLSATGRVSGTPADLAVDADLTGDIATAGLPPGRVTARVHATGLPGAPSGLVEAEGMLDGAALSLALNAAREADGTLRLTIDRAGWKSAQGQGSLTLAPGASLPLGHVGLRLGNLADLRRLTGQALGGSASAELDLDTAGLRASVALADLRAAGATGRLRLDAAGPLTAISLKLDAAGAYAGNPGTLTAAATLDPQARRLDLAALALAAKGETIRLLGPARISFADGISVDRLRLGLRQAVLELAGRAAPSLDLTASLSNVTGDLARAAGIDMDATVAAQARLTGSPARPAGQLRLTATGVRMRSGPGAALPAASLGATAVLDGRAARVDATLAAGAMARLSLVGSAPLDPAGALDLRATGSLDLTLLDPILSPAGRRARGQLTLDAAAAGPLAAPRLSGTARLAKGEVQDFAAGARLSGLSALVQAEGDTLRLVSLDGRAGTGSIRAAGTIGVLAAGQPVDLTLTARDASPLATDRLTATLDADLTVRGALAERLELGGHVQLKRADIRIPERLPANVATLNVRVAGAKPAPPPRPAAPIALDLVLDAPGQVFVRGRGLDAELAGRAHITGTAEAPSVDGGLKLRQGRFSLVGTQLDFSSGEIGFDGAAGLDPTLNFVATTNSRDTTATLTVGGRASKPTITLSSVPELPQDEILARLLFNQATGTLSPFQIAQIAAALAQISGVGGGFDPLDAARRGLGLDRLSVSGSGSGAGLEAGRYIAPGVYLGAKQDLSGNGTKAEVQVDLWRGLKLKADAGAGGGGSAAGGSDPGGSSVGLSWQFDY